MARVRCGEDQLGTAFGCTAGLKLPTQHKDRGCTGKTWIQHDTANSLHELSFFYSCAS